MPLDVAKGHHTAFSRFKRNKVNCAVVPEPSERATGTMFRDGSWRPPLSAVICSSLQLVMFRVKIFAIVFGDRRRSRTGLPAASLRLYINDVPPATIGR